MIRSLSVTLLLVILMTYSLFVNNENTKKYYLTNNIEKQKKSQKTISLVLEIGEMIL